METLKKILRFIASMKFAIILLIVFAVVCMIGSLVPQGAQFDKSAYSERTAGLILGLGLDDVFHSWWFIALTVLLCLNLLLCNLSRVRTLVRRTKALAQPEIAAEPAATAENVADPLPVLRRLRFFHVTRTDADGKALVFAYKNRIGFWGAWICHFGILLIVVGYALGHITLYSSYVYGTPGAILPIENTPYEVTIDDFRIDRTEGGFVEQYVSELTVRNTETGAKQSGTASVNHPAVLGGMKFYQNSTGSAVRVTVTDPDGTQDSAVLCVGEALEFPFMPGLSMYLNAFEPNLDGKPAYQIWFFVNGEFMDVGREYYFPGGGFNLASHTISLSEPMDYTLLRVKKDSFAWLVLVGAILTTLGLFIALYLVPETVWAVQGEDGTWTINGKSRKLAPLFKEQFDRAVSGRKGKEAVK